VSGLSIVPLAESALLVRLSEEAIVDPAISAQAAALADAIEGLDLAGVTDVVPAFTTVMVCFDPRQVDPVDLSDQIEQVAEKASTIEPPHGRQVTIPVAYGGAFGPDLGDVADHAGLSPDEVIAHHVGARYFVSVMGFAPGWAYLLGLPAELAIPRLTNPRTRIPPGSVAIGGDQTGVYPLATPGGWRLIGRTPVRMFEPKREEPFFLQARDAVRFRPIFETEYSEIEHEVAAGTYHSEVELADA
jgi:KipI family sensor histidine kinase inhibitor